MRILPCLPARHHLALAFLLIPGTLPSASAQPPTDGVVFIRIIGDVQLAKGPDPRPWRDTLSLTDTEIGSGSGCLISASGYVLTNYHVIHGGRRKAWKNEVPVDLVVTVKRVEVILPAVPGTDEVEPVHAMEATVVAFDPELDLAVLYVSGAELPYLRLGDSTALRLGDPVVVVGFPLGRGVELEGSPEPTVPSASVSSGTVSGLRGGAAFGSTWPVRYIQTTAAINPGNSGGPMLDDDGNVVGITVGRAEPAQSIGFAIPIELARRFLEMRGLDSALPTQALDLGSFYEAPAKGLRLRVPTGFEDASRRRVHVDSDASLGAMTLRIDRVVSPWAAPEIEEALLGAGAFEAEAMVTLRRGAHVFRGPPGSVVGMAAESSADGTLRMLYVIQRIGREWIVARYVGSADAVAFNRSTLQASLASLEASPLLQQTGAGRIRPVLVPAGPGMFGWSRRDGSSRTMRHSRARCSEGPKRRGRHHRSTTTPCRSSWRGGGTSRRKRPRRVSRGGTARRVPGIAGNSTSWE